MAFVGRSLYGETIMNPPRITIAAAILIPAAVWTAVLLAEPTSRPDPNVGQFSGTMKVLGPVDQGRLEPNPNCGQCHGTATISYDSQSGYSMDLQMQNSSSRKPEIIRLPGMMQDGAMKFANDKYELTLVDRKIVGKRTGRMQAEIEMAPAAQPATSGPSKAGDYIGRR